ARQVASLKSGFSAPGASALRKRQPASKDKVCRALLCSSAAKVVLEKTARLAVRRNVGTATTRRIVFIFEFLVAQIFNLPYRRVALGWAFERTCAPDFSIATQNSILRYGRLKICATVTAAAGEPRRMTGRPNPACARRRRLSRPDRR